MSTSTAGLEFEFPALKEAQAVIDAKAKELAAIFEEAGPELDMSKVKGLGDVGAVDRIRALNAELGDLTKNRDDLIEVRKAAQFNRDHQPVAETGDVAPDRGAKSFGDLFVESGAVSHKGREFELNIEMKTLFSTTAGWGTESLRSPRVVEFVTRPVEVVDLIPQRQTDQVAIKYMEETTFTNAAAEVAEAGTKPEAALALTERTSPVQKVAVWIPVTDEQLEDVVGIRQYLDNRLSFMVRQRLDGQLISGNGTTPNLQGILNRTGIQTQAKGADPTPDAVYKAMTKVRVTGGAIPDAAVFHPNDWQDVRLLRTADGIYIWGNPSEAGPERIWGLRVVLAQASTENTAIVGDFANFTELAWKKGMTVETTNSHDTFFITNKQAVRAEIRVAFQVFRPSAFCSVTGI